MQVERAAASPMEEMGSLKSELDEFESRFKNFVVDRKSVLQLAKRQQNGHIEQLESKEKSLREHLSQSHVNKQGVAQRVAECMEKFHATETVVAGLAKKASHAQQDIKLLKQQVDTTLKKVDLAEQASRYAHTHLDSQAQKDIDESTKFEIYAGLKIDALKEDVLRFRFTNVDANDIDREVFVDLNVGGSSYRVAATSPNLPADDVLGMESELNKHGILVAFLKQIRKALRDTPE